MKVSSDTGLSPEDLVRMLKALSHPVRLRIVRLLADKRRWGVADERGCTSSEVCVCKINDLFDLSLPTVSHHLKLLREAGLVETRREGVWIYYSLNPEVIRSSALSLLSMLREEGRQVEDLTSARGES